MGFVSKNTSDLVKVSAPVFIEMFLDNASLSIRERVNESASRSVCVDVARKSARELLNASASVFTEMFLGNANDPARELVNDNTSRSALSGMSFCQSCKREGQRFY